MYHTLYETFALVDEFYDHLFHFHGAITQMWADIAVTLADAQVSWFTWQRNC